MGDMGMMNTWFAMADNTDMTVRELPVVVQEMSFYEENDGSETRQLYPANHDYFLDETGVYDAPER